MSETAVAAYQASAPMPMRGSLSREQIELIKRTIAKGASDDELALFVAQCNRTGLDPFSRQIYCIKRREYNRDTREYEDKMVTQVAIDGFRLIAERTGKYEGQLGPFWCGPDGQWVDVWLSQDPPAAAKVGILRSGCREPFWGVARFMAYAQTTKDGKLTRMWEAMPDVMIAKCAEALGLRKAFPMELSGLYTMEEMSQADSELPPPSTATRQLGAGRQAQTQIIPKPWPEWSEKARTAFWAKAEQIGLTKEATLAEFNVTDMAEYAGGQNRAATLLHILAAAFENGLNLEQVHEALAVNVIEDWTGTKDAAVAQIDMWLAGQQESAA